VASARAGDRQALDAFLRLQHDRVWAVCRRICGNDTDAADATQEALIAIVRGLPRFDGRSSVSTWCYRVATNACLDELRRRRRRPLASGDDPRLDSEPSTSAPSAEQVVADRLTVDAALAQLPEEFRVPVILRDLCDLDYHEIAELLGVPGGTVRSRISRGRGALATLVGNQTDPADRPTHRP
jgi:RNA polymerase sigma-70 factor (ECF subfamily)